MSLTYPIMVGTYWIFLSGVVYLAGASVVSVLVTDPANADKCVSEGGGRSCAKTALKFAFAVASISLAANIVHVILHCSVMTETDLSEIWDILPAFLTKTRYGQISLARIVLHLLLALTSALSLIIKSRLSKYLQLLLPTFVLLTLAMSGHQGTKGFGSLNLYLDFIHLLAIAVWIGGLLFIRYAYSYLLKCSGGNYAGEYISIVNRFSSIATVSVAVVIVSGFWMLFAFPKSLEDILMTGFGIALIIKVLLVACIAAIGGINKFILIPRINKMSTESSDAAAPARTAFYRTVTAESLIGLAALLATAVLTHLSPMD